MLKSMSAKIAVGVVIITTFLLVFVSTFTLIKTRQDFSDFVSQFEQQQVLSGGQDVPNLPKRILLEQQFGKNLTSTIVIANLLGIIAAMIFAVAISKQITKPLNELKEGIQKLKTNDYKFTIPEDTDEEFQEVVGEFNNLAKQLAKSEDLRQDLISDISHELKTPITSISGQVQGIQDGLFEADEKRLELIQSQVSRLDGLINELREYTHVRADSMRIKKESVNLKKLSEKVGQIFEERLEEKTIKMTINIEDDLDVNADTSMFERVLVNLIDNSIKYSQADLITVSGTDDTIIIEDNGVGVGDEDLELLFERFYRVDKSRNRKSGGLGLGLSIVKEIVDAHDWTITAEHGNDGKGLKFLIDLKPN